jgi:lipoyl-dependent peroxiredoxin
MAVRSASAEWKGNLPEGTGTVTGETGAVNGRYSAKSRFEEGEGTNPEELLAAAHAACFSMALANNLAKAGFTPDSVKTEAKVYLERVDGAPTVTRILLSTEARVPGVSPEVFREQAEATKVGCPISRVVTCSTQVDLDARLV